MLSGVEAWTALLLLCWCKIFGAISRSIKQDTSREREREKRNKQNRAQPIDGCYVNNGCIVGAFCIFSVVVMAPALFILEKRSNGRMSFL